MVYCAANGCVDLKCVLSLAVGIVVMGKLRSSGEKVAIKYHSVLANRDLSYDLLTSVFGSNKEARQYVACVPACLERCQAVFDDEDKFKGHPFALVLEGGDQTLQVGPCM